jgi:selenocysteine lyase/cysteine desulfurase
MDGAATLPAGVTPGTRADYALLRRMEYGRLDVAGHAYLDYTGAGLYAASQVEARRRRMLDEVLGNPHSTNPASADSTARMNGARRRVLQFLHADPALYEVVLTANASSALRLVGESFPFESGSHLVLTADNHNSVNGLRCFARRGGAQVSYVPLRRMLRAVDPRAWLSAGTSRHPHLFAFPAQSNFSGVRHPLGWVALAKESGFRVLLDAAAYVPTTRLRLDVVQADFVCLSFYKMFGLPTGVGALVARRDALAQLERPWFAGGTVDWVSTHDPAYALRAGAEAFEDGTPHFLASDEICDGLNLLERIGMESVEAHVREMTAQLLERLASLRHPGGRRIVEIYGPRDLTDRGGTVTFNVRAASGAIVPFADVVERAGRQRVSVRGGCFCNPGCAEVALDLEPDRARVCRDLLRGRFTPERFADCVGGAAGAVRASVGIPTAVADIERLLEVVKQYRGQAP